MLRKRLPTPLLKELHATSVDPTTGKDLLSPVTDTFHTSTFSEYAEKGHLTGPNTLFDDERVTGSDSLLDDDVLHLTPNDQGTHLPATSLSATSTSEASFIGGHSSSSPLSSLSSRSSVYADDDDSELLNLRPRRRLHLHRTATAIVRRHLRLQRDVDPAVISEVDGSLSNNVVVAKVTDMTGFDVVQSTDSAPNLLNNLGQGGVQRRQLVSLPRFQISLELPLTSLKPLGHRTLSPSVPRLRMAHRSWASRLIQSPTPRRRRQILTSHSASLTMTRTTPL